MTRATQPGARGFRQRKLTPKQPLPIVKEESVDVDEYKSALENAGNVDTGVEKGEEAEWHLQRAIAATQAAALSGTRATEEIPTGPEARESEIHYDELYSLHYAEPATYVRFSQTVEECTGCQYNMTSEDDTFLKAYNQKRPANSQLSEDAFEVIMDIFEETAERQAPFAAVDNTVISFDQMQTYLKQQADTKAQGFSKDIYEYWKARRQASQNRPLQPSLKFETHQDNDADGDPYICFRRREVRQTRKTRARDVQSAEKLRRLRKELEDGRQLVAMAHQRELAKRELLRIDRSVFEQRARVKEAKIRLGIKTDDEDLINQKPQKRKATDIPQLQRPTGGQLRLPTRADGRPIEADLTLLSDVLAQKETLFLHELEQKVAHHTKWNTGHMDLTREPISPVHEHGMEPNFRPAKAHYLMTPPASVSEESSGDHASPEADAGALASRLNSPPEEREIKAYRRRIGRLGRSWIDRKSLPSPGRFSCKSLDERFKYDQDDDDEQPEYVVDPWDTQHMQFRATIPLPNPFPRRQQIEAAPVNNHPHHPHPPQVHAAAQGSASSPPKPSTSVPPQPQPQLAPT